VHAKAANAHPSPQLINRTANTPTQQQAGNTSPSHVPTPRPRIIVGQRPPKSFIKTNVIIEQNTIQPVNGRQAVRNDPKQQKHIEKLSRFFHSERPTSMELYRRNILREPGQDVIDKVQQFDSIANNINK